jgi:hypothetical protein
VIAAGTSVVVHRDGRARAGDGGHWPQPRGHRRPCHVLSRGGRWSAPRRICSPGS